jgi:hypothetical protein
MMDTVDPTDAQKALATVREQRRYVLDASKDPWWVWAALVIGAFLAVASRDFGEIASDVALILAVVLVMLFAVLPAYWPRAAGAMARARVHASVVPGWLRVTSSFAGLAILTAAQLLGRPAAQLLRAGGAPAWAVAHPHVVAAVVASAIVLVIGLVTDRAVRRMARR